MSPVTAAVKLEVENYLDQYAQRDDKSGDGDQKERFSDYLLRKGVISQKILQQLQSEFTKPISLTEHKSKTKKFSKKGKRQK